ncbi:MAG: hypothetical protein QNK37_00425 [Acidobacteriota bacterium]|nr:hypothetical protein [Acidobacteriota bacterium]
MFNLIMTALYEIVMSLKLTTWLEFMSIFTVIMLLGSPGAIATIIGAGSKLGIYHFVRENKEASDS